MDRNERIPRARQLSLLGRLWDDTLASLPGPHTDAQRCEHEAYDVHTHVRACTYTPHHTPYHSNTQKWVEFLFSRFFICSIWDASKLPLNNASEPTVQYSRLLGELCYRFAGLNSAVVGTVCNVGTGKAHPSELSGTLILLSHGLFTVAQRSTDLCPLPSL